MPKYISLFIFLNGLVQGLEVSKCCREDRVFNLTSQTCVLPHTNAYNVKSSDLIDVSETSFLQHCSNRITTIQVDTISDVLHVPDFNLSLPTSEFCVVNTSERNVTVAYCKLIEKCCPSGQILHSTFKKCVLALENQFLPQIKFDGNQVLYGYNATNQDFYHKYCLNRLIPSPNFIELTDKGVVFLTEDFFKKTTNTSYVCVDAVESSKDAYSFTAMVGNPRVQVKFYHNIRKFFPEYCFGSSGFLFLTMIYYCAMPKLRRNLHGYAMICFLFSMMLVQLDLGIAFAIAGYTCVCTFIPFHRNFFRYASTAWTTVMGYMIWRQLRFGAPRSHQRENQAKLFGLYSLYAWGISLLLVIAGIVYEKFNPFTTPCWWASQHVKIFMDVPNITLQLLNNIFFIPSAMHVCKSFKFVNVTVRKDANAVVGQRKMAVIKMFFMMQSTKLAEILFSIRSLFNIQSDEYFMATMCLYSLNGPLLFLVLVDIRSVINSDVAARFKSSVQSTIIQRSTSIVSLFKQSGSLSFEPTPEAIENSDANVAPIKYKKYKEETSSTVEQPVILEVPS